LRVVLRRVVLRRVVLLALLPAQHVLAPVQLVRQALVQALAPMLVLVLALAPVLQLLALNHFCR
jgi:hypothetical protein